jgi:hypothetical protein
MRVYIDGLVMEIEQTLKTPIERICGRTIMRKDIMIVLLPAGQITPLEKLWNSHEFEFLT